MRQWMLKITAYAERLLNDLMSLTGQSLSRTCNATGLGNQLVPMHFKVKEQTKNSQSLQSSRYPFRCDFPLFWLLNMNLVDAITTSEQAEAVADYKHQASLNQTWLTDSEENRGLTVICHQPCQWYRNSNLIADYVLAAMVQECFMASCSTWLGICQTIWLPIVEVLKVEMLKSCLQKMASCQLNFEMDWTNAIAKIVAWKEKGYGQEKVTTVSATGSLAVNVTRGANSNHSLGRWNFKAVPERWIATSVLPVTRISVTFRYWWKSTNIGQSGWQVTREDGVKVVVKQTHATMGLVSWYYLRYIDPHNTEKLADEDLLKNGCQ